MIVDIDFLYCLSKIHHRALFDSTVFQAKEIQIRLYYMQIKNNI